MIFNLANGKTIEKDAKFCVAVKARGRWSHKFFKSHKGADNEIKFLGSCSANTKAYYGIEDFKMIAGA